jgi:hypothetical protein
MAVGSEKLLPVCVNEEYGYINPHGEVIVPCQFDYASEFADGLATIRIYFDYERYKNHEYAVVDCQLNELGRIVCDDLGTYSNGLMAFKRNDRSGYVDATLQIVIPPSFELACDFHDGLARAATDSWNEGIIDRTGNWVIEPKYAYVWQFEKGEDVTGFSRKGELWGLLDRQGSIVADARFQSMGWPSQGTLAAAARVGNQKKWGIIDKRGEWLVEPRWEDTDGGFTDDLMSASIDGKWGLVNRLGDWVIEPRYTNVRKFSDGLCGVYVGGRRNLDYGILDGKYGFINKSGEIVIEPRFDDVSEFKDGVCQVELIDGNPDDNLSVYGYIDTHGQYIWMPTR